MKKSLKVPCLLLIVAGIYSCVSLKHVNDYASNALTGLATYVQLSLDFEKACIVHCRFDKLDSLKTDIDRCYCLADRKADSITLLIYTSLKDYFEGLAKLSDNELTSYKTDKLSTALAGNELGKIQLGEEQAEAFAALSGILLKAFTDEYRKNRIGIYVKEAGEPVTILLDYLDFNISENLQGKIDVLQEKLRTFTNEILLDPAVPDLDKKAVLLYFYNKYDETEMWKEEIRTYSDALRKIKEGHQELAENAGRLKAGEVKKALSQYANNIDTIIREINNLKTN